MSAREYWGPLQRLISEKWPLGITDELIDRGWAPEFNRAALDEFFADHDGEYGEADNEWDTYCKCGKWLERDNYEMPDHLASVLQDSGLLTPGSPAS